MVAYCLGCLKNIDGAFIMVINLKIIVIAVVIHKVGLWYF